MYIILIKGNISNAILDISTVNDQKILIINNLTKTVKIYLSLSFGLIDIYIDVLDLIYHIVRDSYEKV